MEDQKIKNEERPGQMWENIEKEHKRGKVMGGLLIVAIGSLFLARELGAEIPFWVFSWKMLLIGIGLILAVRHKFMHPGWIILIGIGGVFLLADIYPDMQIKPILWPILIILFGLMIIFKPRRKRSEHCRNQWERMRYHHKYHHRHHQHYHHHLQNEFENREEPSKEDFIDSTVIMAGSKKHVLSKDFKGGDITNIMGGTELNLSQADFQGKVNLEITQVFGGTKLIIPSNWEIITGEMVTIMGSVEDKRAGSNLKGDGGKTLVLTGTTIFGGIEIRSF